MSSQLLFNKILIDPGHVGKSLFDFRNFKIDEIQFHEGDFCFAWVENLSSLKTTKNGICGFTNQVDSRRSNYHSSLTNSALPFETIGTPFREFGF